MEKTLYLYTHNDIKTLTLDNFQSHKFTQINLAPGGQLTIIVGQTDSGKTAIFRALRWLLYNQPQGTDFIRGGSTFARVTAVFESGHTIVRERTASKNQYRILSPGASNLLVLEGFGGSVPQEVQDITGIRPVTIGDMDFNLNMAEQLDGPFLGKSISAGTRAKVLGKLAGTEVLDHAGKAVGTDLFRRVQDEKRLAAEVGELTQSLADYDHLPRVAEKIDQLDEIVNDVRLKQDRVWFLISIQNQISQKEIYINTCQTVIKQREFVELAEVLVNETGAKISQTNAIGRLGRRMGDIAEGMITAVNTVERLKNVDLAGEMLVTMNGKVGRAETLTAIKGRLQTSDLIRSRSCETVERLAGIEDAGEMVTETASKQNHFTKLIQAAKMIDAVGVGIHRSKLSIEKATAGFVEAEEILECTNQSEKRLAALYKLHSDLVTSNSAVNRFIQYISEIDQQISGAESVYQVELTASGTCPLCGANLLI